MRLQWCSRWLSEVRSREGGASDRRPAACGAAGRRPGGVSPCSWHTHGLAKAKTHTRMLLPKQQTGRLSVLQGRWTSPPATGGDLSP